MKKLLALLLAVAMMLSLTAVCYADMDEETDEENETVCAWEDSEEEDSAVKNGEEKTDDSTDRDWDVDFGFLSSLPLEALLALRDELDGAILDARVERALAAGDVRIELTESVLHLKVGEKSRIEYEIVKNNPHAEQEESFGWDSWGYDWEDDDSWNWEDWSNEDWEDFDYQDDECGPESDEAGMLEEMFGWFMKDVLGFDRSGRKDTEEPAPEEEAEGLSEETEQDSLSGLSESEEDEEKDFPGNIRLVWESSDPKIAAVDAEGNVEAKAAGTATISCWAEEDEVVFAYCTVAVEEQTEILVESVEFSIPALTLHENETRRLEVIVLPENAENKELRFTSSDESVVTVSENGTVNTIKPGTAVVTGKTADGSELTATIEITVTEENHPEDSELLDAINAQLEQKAPEALRYKTSLEDGELRIDCVYEGTSDVVEKAAAGKIIAKGKWEAAVTAAKKACASLQEKLDGISDREIISVISAYADNGSGELVLQIVKGEVVFDTVNGIDRR